MTKFETDKLRDFHGYSIDDKKRKRRKRYCKLDFIETEIMYKYHEHSRKSVNKKNHPIHTCIFNLCQHSNKLMVIALNILENDKFKFTLTRSIFERKIMCPLHSSTL